MNFDNHGLIIPDVSFYQDDDSTPQKVDFAQMRRSGAVGVIIRAGQNRWEDEDFKDHWREAKAAGLPRGSYWFFDSRAEPGAQATLWRAQVDNDLPELGLWVDLEESYHGTWQGERNWKTFIEAVHIMFPRVMVGIYTANWWWRVQTVKDPVYFGRYPLWVSQYVSTPIYVVLPKPWTDNGAKFWQYTDKGNGPHYGTESLNVDLNYWNGDRESFGEFFKLADVPIPPQPPTGETMSQWYRVTANTLNIRSEAGAHPTDISKPDIGDLHLNDRIEAEGAPVNGWLHIVRILRAGNTVPVLLDGWCSAAYCVAVAPPVTLPPTEPPAVILKHTIKVYNNGSYQVDDGPIVA